MYLVVFLKVRCWISLSIFINYIPDGLVNLFKLFADDSKLLGSVRSNDDVFRIQSDLDILNAWANNSGMKFSIKKCKFLKIGKCPPEVTFPINLKINGGINDWHVLGEIYEDKDLSVVWQNNPKWSEHVNRACSMAYMKLGMLRRTFRTWTNPRTFKLMYTTCVRPHLEYAVPVWNAFLKKDVKKLEKVQERATRFVPQIQDLSYAERVRSKKLYFYSYSNRLSKLMLSVVNNNNNNNNKVFFI